MDEHDDDASVDAARWLQEAGRRTRKLQAPQPEVELTPQQGNALPVIIVFYGQPAPGLGGAHAPIGAGVLEMVIPIAGRSAQAASSRSDATSASRTPFRDT